MIALLRRDIWSTVSGFHAGDAATIWGVTPQDFGLTWMDGQGTAGFTGLTLHATAAGQPTASLTLARYTSADLGDGRLSVSFGADPTSRSAYIFTPRHQLSQAAVALTAVRQSLEVP